MFSIPVGTVLLYHISPKQKGNFEKIVVQIIRRISRLSREMIRFSSREI